MCGSAFCQYFAVLLKGLSYNYEFVLQHSLVQ